MDEASIIEINLSDLDHNLRVVREIIGPRCGICPIVKADAYGLGAVRIARRLIGNGVDMLAVYTPEQAVDLVRSAVGCPILVLMPVREISRTGELYRTLISGKLHLTVHDPGHLDALIAMGERYGVSVPVHLEVDTGMSRGGCSLREAPKVLQQISESRRVNLVGVFTHFANPGSNAESTNNQMKKFDQLLEDHSRDIDENCCIHMASTFAMLRNKKFHRSMVRIGLGWIGYGVEFMSGGAFLGEAKRLQPIVKWKSRIVQIKSISRGTPVGYGSEWTAKRKSVIGLIPVGYADGYPIGLGAKNNKKSGVMIGVKLERHASPESIGYAPVVGAVNMDQITVDLTDLASKSPRIGVGSEVELFSTDPRAPNHLPKIAKQVGTVPHEILCRLNPRVPRVYTTDLPDHQTEVVIVPKTERSRRNTARAKIQDSLSV